MKKLLLLILSVLLTASITRAQSQNALDFDGIDDEVSVPNASSLIAGSAQLSITCWVYPTNANPMYPDFDGFCGFRNEIDCDFYLMQVSPATAIEARLRNSSGVIYTITNQGLTLNAWQHLALTYDGSMLRLYVGGVIVDSVAASGTIANSAETFHMGTLPYGVNPYWLTGKLDEISLFNRALTPTEVACMSQESVSANDPGCMLYYTCNQGIANGVNASINTLHDQSNHIDGNLIGLAMISTFSNFVGGINNASSFAHTICQGDFFQFGTQVLTQEGYYYDSSPLNGGCGNLQELHLFVIAVDTAVTQAGETLTANAAGAMYQWVDCNNGYAIVSGATDQAFSPVVDGSYALVITSGSCTDTSSCYTVTNVGIGPVAIASNVSMFPNPVTDQLTIDFNELVKNGSLTIKDASGKIIFDDAFVSSERISIDVSGLAAGIYFVEVSAANQMAHLKMAKE